MISLLSETTRAVLFGVIVVAFGLNRLARALPHIAWLQVFRLPVRQMSEEERERRKRTANRLAGLEIIIAGMVLPFLYFVPTFMMFNEPKMLPMIIVGVCSVICIGLGIWILARNF